MADASLSAFDSFPISQCDPAQVFGVVDLVVMDGQVEPPCRSTLCRSGLMDLPTRKVVGLQSSAAAREGEVQRRIVEGAAKETFMFEI